MGSSNTTKIQIPKVYCLLIAAKSKIPKNFEEEVDLASKTTN